MVRRSISVLVACLFFYFVRELDILSLKNKYYKAGIFAIILYIALTLLNNYEVVITT
jgi:uncharacterized membrane protein